MRITTAAMFLIALTAMTSAQAAIISQTGLSNDSGVADYGQEIRLDPVAFDSAAGYTLDSATFYKGDLGWRGGNGQNGNPYDYLYLDVYAAPDSTEADPDVDTSTAGLNYLGSSSNFVDYNAAAAGDGAMDMLGDELTWTFSGVTLPTDRDIFLVFSLDGAEGNFVGTSTSTNTVDVPDSSVYSNIVDADSDPLFGGTGDRSSQDHVYSVQLTAVPEPSTIALFLLSFAGLACARAKHRS